MKHWSLFLLTLVFCAAMALSHVPRKVTAHEDGGIGKVVNMTSQASTDSNAVEVGGIRLEILVPNQVWRIPEKQPDSNTHVQLGLQIKNNTPYPIRFPPFDPLIVLPLEMVEPDGEFLQQQAARDILLKSPQLTCPLIQPRESVTFFLNAKLFWHNNKLLLGGTDELGGGWHFDNLKPGNYQIRLRYISSRGVLLCYDSQINEDKLIQGIWTGQITTPFVNFRLVQS